MKQALSELDQAVSTEDSSVEQLTELKKEVEHHVEEEETVLFPLAQKLFDRSEGDEIAIAIERDKATRKAKRQPSSAWRVIERQPGAPARPPLPFRAGLT